LIHNSANNLLYAVAMELSQLMSESDLVATGAGKLSQEEQIALASWGLRMFSLGQHRFCEIEEIKYGGRLIVLSDNSRWEVDELDASTAELWSPLDKVVVIDDEMWKLDDFEKVAAMEET
jgi:hypothetical protein